MDGATLGVIGTLGGAAIASVVAVYGHRISSRSGLMTGYNMLTSDLRQERADLRQQLATEKAERAAIQAQLAAVQAENTALRAQVISLGGIP